MQPATCQQPMRMSMRWSSGCKFRRALDRDRVGKFHAWFSAYYGNDPQRLPARCTGSLQRLRRGLLPPIVTVDRAQMKRLVPSEKRLDYRHIYRRVRDRLRGSLLSSHSSMVRDGDWMRIWHVLQRNDGIGLLLQGRRRNLKREIDGITPSGRAPERFTQSGTCSKHAGC